MAQAVGGGVIAEAADVHDGLGECPDKRRDEECQQQGHQKRLARADADAGVFPGAVVLPRVGGQRGVESVAWQVQIQFHAVPDGERGRHRGAEAVHGTLDEGQAKGYDGELEDNREADANGFAGHGVVPAEVRQAEAEDGIAMVHVEIGRGEGAGLGDDRGGGGARHAPAEGCHEKQVHSDVQDGGD